MGPDRMRGDASVRASARSRAARAVRSRVPVLAQGISRVRDFHRHRHLQRSPDRPVSASNRWPQGAHQGGVAGTWGVGRCKAFDARPRIAGDDGRRSAPHRRAQRPVRRVALRRRTRQLVAGHSRKRSAHRLPGGGEGIAFPHRARLRKLPPAPGRAAARAATVDRDHGGGNEVELDAAADFDASRAGTDRDADRCRHDHDAALRAVQAIPGNDIEGTAGAPVHRRRKSARGECAPGVHRLPAVRRDEISAGVKGRSGVVPSFRRENATTTSSWHR